MEEGREERCIGASSCAIDSDESSSYCDDYYRKEVMREGHRCHLSSSLWQRRFSVLSCTIVCFLALGVGGIANQGVGLAAAAGIVLPVSRSFSKMEGSGTAEGESGGMTPEHFQQLRNHDYHRGLRHHGRFLASTTIADFPLGGNDYEIGLYYTMIRLGTPSSEYYVQVDTGSDLLWVNCKPCPDCPSSSDLHITLRLYDPGSSSTSSNTSCSSDICQGSANAGTDGCVDDSCYYSFMYGDGSTAMGYLVQDTIIYDTGVVSNQTMSSTSASVVFGCGFKQTGESLTSSSRATDGIMGFGPDSISVVSQLANAGLTTSEFSHCLQGDTGEGGTFVIGEVNEPGVVYTDLITTQSHYNVALQSIFLGGNNLNVSSSAFDISGSDTGTIFDSGTTLALLVDEAYTPLVQQLVAQVAIAPQYVQGSDAPCFESQDSNLQAAFPNLTLNFAGPVSMDLVPTNYLLKYRSDGHSSLWCLAWASSGSNDLKGLTILGDIVLKNKLVVYDLGKDARVGWVDYNCLSPINVSNGSRSTVISPQGVNSASYSLQFYHPIAVLICTALLIFAAAFF